MRNYWQTFTVTVASPAVFTCTDHGLAIGDRIILETTGALPTGLTADTQNYYVIRDGYTTSTFQVSTEYYVDGDSAPVATTGSQSGTHTFLKMTRNKITFTPVNPR